MFEAISRFFQRATSGVVTDTPKPRTAAEAYKDFMIQPRPRKEGNQWLTAGVITKEGPEGLREAEFIRSDMFASQDDAEACALAKGRQIIDEQGDRVFDKPSP